MTSTTGKAHIGSLLDVLEGTKQDPDDRGVSRHFCENHALRIMGAEHAVAGPVSQGSLTAYEPWFFVRNQENTFISCP